LGNFHIKNKISSEDMQFIISKPNDFIIINTLPDYKQHCLIQGTLSIQQELIFFNKPISNKGIVIYGMNNNDQTIITKYKDLINRGYPNVYIYIGGLFEWLLLQDIYGSNEFPTTNKELNILQYQPINIIKP